MSEIVRAAAAVVTARQDHIEAVDRKNTRGENAAAVRLEIALENLTHALEVDCPPSDNSEGLDLAPIEAHWRAVLDGKPSKGPVTQHQINTLIDSACDVPELLHEILRLRGDS